MPTLFFNIRRAWLVSAVALAFPLLSSAQDKPWPQAKPITWLIGFAPGGSADVLTRAVARQLSEKIGQSIVVDNRPGASGAIALQAAVRAAPDGYTLITVPGPFLMNVPVPEVGKELVPIAMMAEQPMVLVGLATAQSKTLNELLKQVRENPKAWSFASSGNGSSQHLAGELINVSAGLNMTHIPYKGGSQAVNDVLGGQVPLGMLGVTPVLPHIKSGKLRAYAVTTHYRIESLPDVPTMQEAGMKAYDASQWYVLAGPTGIPAERIAALNGLVNEIVASPELRPVMLAGGSVAGKGSPKDAQAFLAADAKKWKELAAKTKLDLNP
jgi:tripartite-type tricarboxylate transporter receptor subunit TctC